MRRLRSSIFSFDTLAFRSGGWRSALTAVLAAGGCVMGVEALSRAALDPVGRYWEYPRAELAVTYEWFRSASLDKGLDVAVAGDSTAARNVDPQLLANGLEEGALGCNLGWPANFPMAFRSLTLPVLKSTAKAPAALVLSFSPLGFVESPLAQQFEAGLLSSPICRRQDQGWLVSDYVRVARWRAALPWKQLWFTGPERPMVPPAGGFQPLEGSQAPDSDDDDRRQEALASVSWTIDEDRFGVLREAAEWSRDRGVSLYIVVPPRLDPGPERLTVEAEYLARLESLVDELGASVLDLREPGALTDEDFFDGGHLNRKGAERFTRHVADTIAGRHESRDDTSSRR